MDLFDVTIGKQSWHNLQGLNLSVTVQKSIEKLSKDQTLIMKVTKIKEYLI